MKPSLFHPKIDHEFMYISSSKENLKVLAEGQGVCARAGVWSQQLTIHMSSQGGTAYAPVGAAL